MKNFLTFGQHRNFELAERKARALKLQYKADKVEIVARRNASGRFSTRGQFFTFAVFPGGRVEYVLHFDYGNKKRKGKGASPIRFQLHLIGPNDATDNEAIAVGIAIDLGTEKIEGWKFKIITWGHPPKPCTNPWDEKMRDLYEAATTAGRRKVAQRKEVAGNSSTAKNRSVKK